MRPKTITITPADADRNGICASQTPSAAGTLTIAGALATAGVATLDPPGHVSIYGGSDESGDAYLITGTDRHNDALTENIIGPNATTVIGSKNFKTVTEVYVNGAATGAVEIGSADELESQWVPVEWRGRTSVSVRESEATELFVNSKDRDFTGGSTNWTNVSYASFDETTDLSLTADAVGDYCTITCAAIGTNLVSGRTYQLLYDHAETVAGFQFQLVGAGTQVLGTAVAGSQQKLTFIASEHYQATDTLRIVAITAATAEGDFDNFSLIVPQESTDLNYVPQYTMENPWGPRWDEHDADPIDGVPVQYARAVRLKVVSFVAGTLYLNILSSVQS